MLQILLPLCALFAGASAAGCAQNNCYNAFTHSLSIASPFCSTYIQSTITISAVDALTPANTILPQTTNAQLSSRCVLDTNTAGAQSTSLSLRLSSACSCINVVPATVTVTVPAPIPACTQFTPTYVAIPATKTFSVDCAVAPGASGITYASEPTRNDPTYAFKSCMDACASYSDCVAVFYFTDGAAGYLCIFGSAYDLGDLLYYADGEFAYLP